MQRSFDHTFGRGWKTFEQVIRKKLQTIQAAARKSSKRKSSKAAHILSEAMEKSLQHLESSKFSGLTYNLFETHRSIVIRLLLPNNTDPRRVVIENKRTGIRISGVPGKKSEMIHLPAPVLKRSGNAAFMKGTLEIHLTKRKKGTQSKAIKVPFR